MEVLSPLGPQNFFAGKLESVILIHEIPPIFAGLGKDGSIWAAVVEKMFAKWYGNWEHLVGGWMAFAVSALNGSPFKEKQHSGNSETDIWNFINNANQDNDIITAGSNFCGNDSETTDWGVACSHAYTILHTAEITRADGSKVKILQCRNPWGAEQYNGPWADSWSGWTDHDKT